MTHKAALSDIEATRRRLKKQGKDVKIDFILIDDDDPKAKPEAVVRILDNNPIRKLYNRGTISREQFAAAEQLYSDWYVGGMVPRLVKPFKIIQVDEGSPEMNESDYRLMCMDRCFKAMKFLRAKQLQCIIEELLLHCRPISDVAKQFIKRKQQDQAKAACIELLKVGLNILIEFYENN